MVKCLPKFIDENYYSVLPVVRVAADDVQDPAKKAKMHKQSKVHAAGTKAVHTEKHDAPKLCGKKGKVKTIPAKSSGGTSTLVKTCVVLLAVLSGVGVQKIQQAPIAPMGNPFALVPGSGNPSHNVIFPNALNQNSTALVDFGEVGVYGREEIRGRNFSEKSSDQKAQDDMLTCFGRSFSLLNVAGMATGFSPPLYATYITSSAVYSAVGCYLKATGAV